VVREIGIYLRPSLAERPQKQVASQQDRQQREGHYWRIDA
jgi:hypothetical protein